MPAREIQEAFFPSIGDAQAVAEARDREGAAGGDQTFVLMDSHSFREGEPVPSTLPRATAKLHGSRSLFAGFRHSLWPLRAIVGGEHGGQSEGCVWS